MSQFPSSEPKPFQFLTARQVQELTGISAQSLANQRHLRKGIPYHKVGGSIRYRWADVLAFMDSCRIDLEGV
jgi:hypothetical protein